MNPEPNSIYREASCSYGTKAVKLLRDKGVEFEDHVLESRIEVEELKDQLHVETTPQVFLEGKRVGGYSELAQRFNIDAEEETSYIPVIAVFSVALLLALSTGLGVLGFMGFSLTILATLKLMDIPSFVTGFKQYDLITKKVPNYAKAYPFIELAIGLAFLSGAFIKLAGLLAIAVGLAGGYSVFRAVYLEKRDLNCACIGGGSKAPLGSVSFIENAIMTVMGLRVLFIF